MYQTCRTAVGKRTPLINEYITLCMYSGFHVIYLQFSYLRSFLCNNVLYVASSGFFVLAGILFLLFPDDKDTRDDTLAALLTLPTSKNIYMCLCVRL